MFDEYVQLRYHEYNAISNFQNTHLPMNEFLEGNFSQAGKINSAFKGIDKMGNSLGIILVVSVDSHDPLIALIQGKGVGTTKLSAQLSGPCLDQQTSYPNLLQVAQLKGAIHAAAIDNDDVSKCLDLKCGHSGQEVLDSFALIDDRDYHTPRLLFA